MLTRDVRRTLSCKSRGQVLRSSLNAAALMSLVVFASKAEAQWTAVGTSAHLITQVPDAPMPGTMAALTVMYEAAMKCQPSIGLTVVVGRDLGQPMDRGQSNDPGVRLGIQVGGQFYTNSTRVTKYTKGIDFTMIASAPLIAAIENSQAISATAAGGALAAHFVNNKGAKSAFAAARKKCG